MYDSIKTDLDKILAKDETILEELMLRNIKIKEMLLKVMKERKI